MADKKRSSNKLASFSDNNIIPNLKIGSISRHNNWPSATMAVTPMAVRFWRWPGRAISMHKPSAIYATYCRPILHRHWPAVWSWWDWTTATRYSTARQSAASRSCSVCRTMHPESSSRHRGGPIPNRWCVKHWLPVQHRIENWLQGVCVDIQDSGHVCTTVPQPTLNRLVNARTLRSTATPLLIQPFARIDFAKRSFRCAAPSVWNSLPVSVIGSDSLYVFKSRLKHSYFVGPLTSTHNRLPPWLWSHDLMALYKYAYNYFFTLRRYVPEGV